ncbi:MAG: hypothetical protein GX542_04770 [Rhodococcus sp.]|nr:hypothetical protein [Rhodococcus sp. (in: high G+C Gram-positive bacteria)]
MNWGHSHQIITRRNALARGYSDDELYRAKHRGEIVSIGCGAYVDWADYRQLDTAARHRLAINVAAQRTGNGAVVSHTSAAILHGLDTWRLDINKVDMTLRNRVGGTTTGSRRLHSGPLDDEDISVVDGIAVTSGTRTVVDIACTNGFEEAVVVGDHALRTGKTTFEKLDALLGRSRRRRGIVGARRVAAFLDALSESVGESRSRVQIVAVGFPKPELQQPIYDNAGNLIARVDFLWRDLKIIGEFDGLGKYSMVDGKTEYEVLRAEKRREDQLRALGYVVVRWTWADLENPQRLRALLEQAFRTATALKRS